MAALVGVLALVGCQPAQEPQLGGAAADRAASGNGQAVAQQTPATLTELTRQAGDQALRWHGSARLVGLRVELASDGAWTAARARYLAPGARRLFVVEWAEGGRQQHRPRLAGLGLAPIPAAALAAVPALPENVTEPGELADASKALLKECGLGSVPAAVLYASGAPEAWRPDDGGWSRPPEWTATVTNRQGGGVALDPVTAEPASPTCFDAASAAQGR